MGLLEGTFIVFLILKIIGYLTWSWWWVTAPLWGSMLTTLPILLYINHQRVKINRKFRRDFNNLMK
jgi:hypothetical protein